MKAWHICAYKHENSTFQQNKIIASLLDTAIIHEAT